MYPKREIEETLRCSWQHSCELTAPVHACILFALENNRGLKNKLKAYNATHVKMSPLCEHTFIILKP